jgi:predicted GNAT family N-acyltransferase
LLGTIFAFELHGKIIGTLRVIPCKYNLTLTEKLLGPIVGHEAELWRDSWEVGRLVLAPEYRSGQELLKRCLFLALQNLCSSTKVGSLLASCSHVLSRLYRRFAFVVIEKAVALEGTEKIYSLIHGCPQMVMAALGDSTPNS